MTILSKEGTLFERDETGNNLLGIRVTLETVDGEPEIIVKPLVRAQLLQLQTQLSDLNQVSERDKQLVVDHCMEPKYTLEEVERMKPKLFLAISTAILAVSADMSQKSLLDALTKKNGDDVMNEIVKKK